MGKGNELNAESVLDIFAIGREKSEVSTFAAGHGTDFMTVIVIVSGGSTHEFAASSDFDFLADGFAGFSLRHKDTDNKGIMRENAVYEGTIVVWNPAGNRLISSSVL